jgi:methanogenic corrinoid protein MtbC1/DNA-binding XRE family transcriptional regulator
LSRKYVKTVIIVSGEARVSYRRLDLEKVHQSYLEALLEVDDRRASEVIAGALDSGISAVELHMEVLMPAGIRIGELWHTGSIGVAEEHAATEITIAQMARIRERSRPKRLHGHKAVIAGVYGDLHSVGARAAADLLYLEGWDVDYLGPNTPPDEIRRFTEVRDARLVAISSVLIENSRAVEESVRLLKELADPPLILLGGHGALSERDRFERMGTVVVSDLAEAVREAQRLLAADAGYGLERLLLELGERIREARKAKGLSQQELSATAGLDRTYLSAVERGRQNLTIGALLRIAKALDRPLEDLLLSR